MGDDKAGLFPEIPARACFPVVVRIPLAGAEDATGALLGLTAAWTAQGIELAVPMVADDEAAAMEGAKRLAAAVFGADPEAMTAEAGLPR